MKNPSSTLEDAKRQISRIIREDARRTRRFLLDEERRRLVQKRSSTK